VNPEIAARTCHHHSGILGVLAPDDGDGGQIAVQVAQRGVARCVGPGDDELDAREGNRVGGALQARLYDGRRRKVGDVEYRARSAVLRHRLAQNGVGQPGDHPHLGVGLPCQQRDFEVQRIVVIDTDHGPGVADPGRVQTFRGLQRHDARVGVVQLFDDSHR
jgi:hypothetical protein